MAIEARGYPAWNSFPVTGPSTSPSRPIDVTTGGARITLSGTTFSARIQISNAQAKTVAAHLFLPAENDWETYSTVTATDGPVFISAPVRWVRILLDSGTITGGQVEESTRVTPMVNDQAVQEYVSDRVDMGLPGQVEIKLPAALEPLRAAQPLNVSAYASLTAAHNAIELTRQTRLDLPPLLYTVTNTISPEKDLHLHGAGGGDWIDEEGQGTEIQAAGGVANLYNITGRLEQFVNPDDPGGPLIPAYVGALSAQGINFTGQGTGAPTTNAAFKFSLGNGPFRPVIFNQVTMRRFLNAIDVVVTPGLNTGIGPLIIRDSVFTKCTNAIRSRGSNGILQMHIADSILEQGARIDIQADPVLGGPGAMGNIEITNVLMEGQSDAVKIHGGSMQVRIDGMYLERNTGRVLDLKASTRNSSVEITRLNTEHDPVSTYLEGFGRALVRTYGPKMLLHVTKNGPRSEYQGMRVLPIFDTENSMLTACSPQDTLAYASPDAINALGNGYVAVPAVASAGRVQTPWGERAHMNVTTGDPIQLSFTPFGVGANQVVVVCVPVRWISGSKAFGYGVYDAAGSLIDSKDAQIDLDDQGWTLVTFAHRLQIANPNVKFGWRAGIPGTVGTCQVGDAWTYVVASDAVPILQFQPQLESFYRTSGRAIIPMGVDYVIVNHGLPGVPKSVRLTARANAKVWEGGDVGTTGFYAVTDAPAPAPIGVNWEANL